MDLVSFETPIEFKMFEEVMIAGKYVFHYPAVYFFACSLSSYTNHYTIHNVEISKLYFNGTHFVKIFVKSFSSNFFTK